MYVTSADEWQFAAFRCRAIFMKLGTRVIYDGSFIKLDVQGFEERVLLGVGEALTHVSGVYLEAALEPDYQNSCMFDDLHAFMQSKNFALVHTEPGYVDPATGYRREINCMYVNKKLHPIQS